MFTSLYQTDEVQKYVDFLNDSALKIAVYTNQNFIKEKENIKQKILEKIKKYLNPVPTHFEWEYDGCPYDHSGILVKNGLISLKLTISEFLEDEYTGTSIPTYESGCGLRYETYGDDLSYYTLDLAYDIMLNSIKKYTKEHFQEEVSEKTFEVVRNIRDFDDVYDECYANQFFCSEGAIDFIGIGKIRLSELVASV